MNKQLGQFIGSPTARDLLCSWPCLVALARDSGVLTRATALVIFGSRGRFIKYREAYWGKIHKARGSFSAT